MIDKNKLKLEVIRCLSALDMDGAHAINLVMGTFAQESHFKYVRQIGGGPALGYGQMEPATFNDICNNWLQYQNKNLIEKVKVICEIQDFKPAALLWNVPLMIVFTRLHYRRVKAALPTTIEGYAAYWKKYYNTELGAGTEAEFIKNYNTYVL